MNPTRQDPLFEMAFDAAQDTLDPDSMPPETVREVSLETRIDCLIDLLDRRLAAQLDEILHHPAFQALERAWRGLKFVVDRVDFRENIKVEILQCSLDDLRDDLEGARPIEATALFQPLEASHPSPRPYAAVLFDDAIGPSVDDVALLRRIAELAMVSFTVFIAEAHPRFFGGDDRRAVERSRGAEMRPGLASFESLRAQPNARFIGLTVGKMLLRPTHQRVFSHVDPDAPESEPAPGFVYAESADDADHLLWGRASLVLAVRMADCFAKYRWCPNITGEEEGRVDGLPVAPDATSVDVSLEAAHAAELAERGFIPLTSPGPGSAWLLSANSIRKPKHFGTSLVQEFETVNDLVDTQLPYTFVILRVAQYLHSLQRENLGAWKAREDLERELNEWTEMYVSSREVFSPAVRSRRPLYRTHITVTDSQDKPAWRDFELRLRPQFKRMGIPFVLTLATRLFTE